MKTIGSWSDLGEYGIVVLTGEACGLTYRLLCDVTEKGKRVIEKCFDSRLTLESPWNRGSETAPHVGSIMLAPELRVPLAVFALLESGCTEVWVYANNSVLGVEADDTPERIEACRRMAPEAHVRTLRYGGTAGDRNLHVMSGRVR